MRIPNIFKYLIMCIEAMIPVLLVSDPGMGKTSVVKQVAEHLGMKLYEFHAASWESPEIKGIMKFGDKVASIQLLDFIHGENDVEKVMMQVVRGYIGNIKLPSNIHVIGCTNDVHRSMGVRGMIEPHKSSYNIVRMEHDSSASLRHAKEQKWHKHVCAFLETNPEYWHMPDPEKARTLENTPCARQWERVSNQCFMFDKSLKSEFITLDELAVMEPDAFGGSVGITAGKLFAVQRQVILKNPAPRLVLEQAATIPLPRFDTEQSALYMLVVSVAGLFAEKKDENGNIQPNIYRNPEARKDAWLFAERLPSVFQRLFCEAIWAVYEESQEDAFSQKRMQQDAASYGT
jgi:hypothetical protein